MTGEQLEEVLLGESKVIDSNMRGRALTWWQRPTEERNYYSSPNLETCQHTLEKEVLVTGDFRDASTGTPY